MHFVMRQPTSQLQVDLKTGSISRNAVAGFFLRQLETEPTACLHIGTATDHSCRVPRPARPLDDKRYYSRAHGATRHKKFRRKATIRLDSIELL